MSDLGSARWGRQLPPGGYWNPDSSLPPAMFRARRAGVDKDTGFYSDKAKPLSRPADKARKASAYAALWIFVSLLAGAFVASLAATFGGRQRDL